jgi:hypothetical protein
MQKISRHSDGIPTTHTLLVHSPSITQQTGQTGNQHQQPAPRPAPAPHKTDTECSSSSSRFPIPSGISRAKSGVGECAAAAHMQWWVVLHLGPPSFASLVSLTMPLPGAQGLGLFDNALLRGGAIQTCSYILKDQGLERARNFQDSLLRARAGLTNGLVESDNGRCARLFGRDD